MDAWNSNYKSHQGNLGLGAAIAYYTSQCIPISIPLNDTQGHDLVIDDGTLKRVQVPHSPLIVFMFSCFHNVRAFALDTLLGS